MFGKSSSFITEFLWFVGGAHLKASDLSSVWCNHPFKPAQLEGVFVVCRGKGIQTLADVYIDDSLHHVDSSAPNLPNSHFFLYLQIQHYVKEELSSYETASTHLSELPALPPGSRHFVSKLVGCF